MPHSAIGQISHPNGAATRANAIGVVTSDPADAALQRWWSPLETNWPEGGLKPEPEFVDPDALLADPHSLIHVRRWDAVVVVEPPSAVGTRQLKVLDVLQQALVPTMILSVDASGTVARFQAGGHIALHRGTNPATLAAMLFALAQRQSVIRSLDRHLAMVQSFQGEAVAEIDRLHDELLIAAKVQRDFLPKDLPSMEGMEASVIFRPAGFVSGDIYDVYRLDENRVGFFVADAMGHGVPAALMTLFISGHMPRRDVEREGRIVSPGHALERLNQELHDAKAGATRFVTAVAGQFDLRNREFLVAAAGHPPPIRVTEHGLEPIDASGMLLGVVGDSTYEEVTFRLEPNETLVLHSDGVEVSFQDPATDAAIGGKANHAYREYFAGMAATCRGPLDESMRRLAAHLDKQRGSINQPDDVTILAFRPGGD